MHEQKIYTKGKPLEAAEKALVMIHGRGASAADIFTLSDHLNIADFALLAPQATNNTWYPNSFLLPPHSNEPWLSSALDLLGHIEKGITEKGIQSENIYFLGFSQGSCLTLEYTTRNAKKYGGIIAFTGGLIGDKIYQDNYNGNFSGTKIYIGTSDPDMHVPVERVKESKIILSNLNADVTVDIYKNMGHTIIQEEIEAVNKLIFK